MNIKKQNIQYFIPTLYVGVNTKVPEKSSSTVTLENIINLQSTLGNSIKELLTYYMVLLLTLLWGAQTNINAKLTVNKRAKNSSKEKVFQQTNSHRTMTTIIAKSISARTIISLTSIQKAINKEMFGINDEERESDESLIESINKELIHLIAQKGSGSTRISVRDTESRGIWLRATNSSFRSTLCAAPTFSPSKLISSGSSLKLTKPDSVYKHFVDTCKLLVNQELISEEDIPSLDDIKGEIISTLETLKIEEVIEDDLYGTFNVIPLDEIFGFKRYTMKSDEKPTKTLPTIMSKLKGIYKSSNSNLRKPLNTTILEDFLE